MDIARAAMVGVALVTLASMPCLIAWMIVNADTASDRAGRTIARWRPGSPAHTPIEEVASRVRGIAAELADTPLHHLERRAELTQRYETALRQACALLEIPQYLDRLTGSDSDMERLRVEGELEAAGVVVRGPMSGSDTPPAP